ncbi:hypothetical protein A2609_01875 [Candidatus Kaiserbacteria bacterium RIFOXYD1_FULL_47_14]|uniref:Protein kinase domain-containing protein n=1 Tax=Candidatus Kaiserbacteria bacterium RIFOXYD1_FULL_47_14 TaxID=1798533 RepID=A0A1F6G5S4_9BACT|nr:MAG: hypothetical protein A2609_01875 [Candidatus Kaiserbacteria bacterium RIFOXYD1_FULL_47_14]
MKVHIDDKGYDLHETALLEGGEGGEGKVYKFGLTQLVKVYDDPTEERARKLTSSLGANLYKGLEAAAAVPKKLVKDEWNKQAIGFVMDRVEGYEPLTSLWDMDNFRNPNGLGLKFVTHVFCELHHHINAIHKAGFCLGDLNEGNALIQFSDSDVDVKIIDVDSWGFVGNSTVPSWKVSAINSSIDHPKLSLQDKSGAAKKGDEYFAMMRDRDWFAYALHLTHALTALSPFEEGKHAVPAQLKVTDPAERKKKGLHLWHADIRLTRQDMITCVRPGWKAVYLLKNWVAVNARGPFPIWFLANEFVSGIVNCRECHMEVHKSCVRCPKCFTKL